MAPVLLDASAADFLAQHLASLDGEMPSLLLRVTRQTDPEAIHDLRVTIRRLRTLLRLARPIFGRHHTDLIRGVYTNVARSSGALRDEEVFLELLEKYGASLPEATHTELESLRVQRSERERALRGDVLRTLETDDVTQARTMLGALLTLPVRPKKDRDLARFARRAVIEALSGVDSHRDAAADDIQGLHDLRIAYKRLRYTLEFFSNVLPPDLTAAHDAAVRFQKRLGDIHDLDMAITHIEEAATLSNDLRTSLLGSIREARNAKMAAFEAEMRPATVLRR